MASLEEQLSERDLKKLADFEVAVVRASFEVGLLAKAKQSKNIGELVATTNIEKRVLEAVVPVLVNANALSNNTEPKFPEDPKRTERLTKFLEGGNAFLMGSAQSFSDMWESGEIDVDSARKFSLSMFKESQLPAQIHCQARSFKSIRSLADLGGGGGAWASEALQAHPTLNYSIFDLKNVCVATSEILAQQVPQIRVQNYLSGNFFRDDLPKADGYLLSNILHDWSFEKCSQLLRHIHRYADSDSSLFIHESLLRDDKSGPRFTALFNLLMLLNHSSQQFTLAELSALLVESGFDEPKVVSTAAHYSLLVAKKSSNA